MPINITFRTQLLGGVSEFSQGVMLPFFSNTLNLVELIVLLARYQEEGAKLSPKVYITNDIEMLCSMLPDSERIKIGYCKPDSSGIKEVLKKCAPLANGGWCIYLNNYDGQIDFGLFKGPSNPISVLIDDVVMTNSDELIVVKAFQITNDCVEIQSNKGGLHYIFLNHQKEDSPPPLQYLENLVTAITTKVNQEHSEPTKSFLKKLLFDVLRDSHGCIVAVTGMKKVPSLLSSDGIILENPINFAELVKDVLKNSSTQSYLESKGFLLKGMLNSDGIILFDSSARLLGYNCFVKVNKKNQQIGGARKRAFATLASKLGKGLNAVFMQSQDGWSEFKGI